jgi:hypothetical protein
MGRKITCSWTIVAVTTKSNELDAELDDINTSICFLVPNSTQMEQPLDLFVIGAMQKHWSEPCMAKKLDLIKKPVIPTQW